MKRLLIAIALAALTCGAALAQNQPEPAPASKARKPAKACADPANPRCARQVTFTRGDKLEGDRPGGDGDAVTGLLRGRFGPLIRLRTSFVAEIYKSAESI